MTGPAQPDWTSEPPVDPGTGVGPSTDTGSGPSTDTNPDHRVESDAIAGRPGNATGDGGQANPAPGGTTAPPAAGTPATTTSALVAVRLSTLGGVVVAGCADGKVSVVEVLPAPARRSSASRAAPVTRRVWRSTCSPSTSASTCAVSPVSPSLPRSETCPGPPRGAPERGEDEGRARSSDGGGEFGERRGDAGPASITYGSNRDGTSNAAAVFNSAGAYDGTCGGWTFGTVRSDAAAEPAELPSVTGQ